MSVTVRPVLDETLEGTETVQLRVLDNFAYTVSATSAEATVQIQDFVPPPPLPPPPPTIISGPPVEITIQGNDILEGPFLNNPDPTSTAPGAPVAPREVVFRRLGTDISDPINVFFTTGPTGTTGSTTQTAIFGQDYVLRDRTGAINNTGQVNIPAGGTSVSLFIDPQDDNLAEPDELIQLNVVPGVGYQLGTNTSASLTLTDNDFVSIIASRSQAFEPFEIAGKATDGGDGSYLLTRQGGTEGALTVNFDVITGGIAGTAVATRDVDYQLLDSSEVLLIGNTVTIPAGQQSTTVILRPLADADPGEPQTEVARLQLSPTTNYGILPGNGQADVLIFSEGVID